MAVWIPTPMTATAGAVLTAAQWNANVRDFALGFGAWGSYTPALTGVTTASPTMVGKYRQVQKDVAFEAQATLTAAITAVASTATFSLPVTATTSQTYGAFMRGIFIDTGVNVYGALAVQLSSTTAALYIPGTSDLLTAITTTTPFTWGNTDQLRVGGSYEAA